MSIFFKSLVSSLAWQYQVQLEFIQNLTKQNGLKYLSRRSGLSDLPHSGTSHGSQGTDGSIV